MGLTSKLRNDEQRGWLTVRNRQDTEAVRWHDEQIRKQVLEEAAQLCFEYAAKCGDSAEEYAARRLGDAIRALGAT